MPTYTLRPNANWGGASLFTISGGSASVHAALSDNSDSTFVRRDTTYGTATYQGEVGTSTIPANERISYINMRVRMAQGATGRATFALGVITDRNARTVSLSPTVFRSGTLATSTVDLAFNLTTAPNGAAWTQTYVDNLVFYMTDLGTTTDADRPSFYEVYVDVVTSTQPTVTATAPSGTVTTTSFPSVQWTFADTEGDLQSAYQVKIFDSATYGLAGFSPDTSTATIDTGVVNSTDTGAALTVDLANSTTYRAYVRAAHLLNGGNYFSNWSYSEFTMSLQSPAAPQISGFYEESTGATTVTILGRTNMLSANQASLEVDTTGWTGVTNAAITRSTAQAAQGSASLALTAASSGDMSARTTTGTAFTVSALGTNSAYAVFRADTTGRQCKIGIEWRNAGGSVISTTYGSNVTDTNSGWTTATATGSAPSSAVSATVIVYVTGAGASEVHYVDTIAFHAGTSPTWTVGGYTGLDFVIERSVDGVTWSAVRGSPVTASAAQTAEITDYEAPLTNTVTYRAKARGNI